MNTYKHVHNYKSQLHTFGKQYKVLAKSYLGFCKKNNTADIYDTYENYTTYFLMLYTQLTVAYVVSPSQWVYIL